MSARLLLAVAVAAVLLAGCSGSPSATTPTKDSQGRYVIHMTSANQFSPAHAKVPVGATVVWMNDGGGANHDVQARDESFSSGAIGGLHEGDSFAHTFNQTGSFDYFCHVHDGQGMHGTITVS